MARQRVGAGPSFDFVRFCLGMQMLITGPRDLARLLDRCAMNWEEAAFIGYRELVLPALFPGIKDTPIVKAIPEDFSSLLEMVNFETCARNKVFLVEAKSIASLLNRGGIEPVFLKGIAFLAMGLHKDLGVRWACDIDILIGSDEYVSACSILKSQGYQAVTPCDPVHHHYSVLTRHDCSPPVEIHRRLGTLRTGLLAPNEVIDNSRAVNWNGVSIRIPSYEHLLTHTILHAENDSGPSLWIWPPLRALFDFAHLAASAGPQFDWTLLRKRFKAFRCEHLLDLFVWAAEDILHFPRPYPELGKHFHFYRIRMGILRKWPLLRYLDPLYVFSMAIAPRLARGVRLVKTRGGLRYLAGRTFRPSLLGDILRDVARRA